MKVPHILIVDDEPNIVMSLEFLMRKNGYQVGIARNGTEALAAIAQTCYDLVLLDVMMPDVDGYQVCRELRELPGNENTRVIFLSAKSREADVQKGYEVGADLYISKPFSTRQLVEKVRELLAHPVSR
ncbi:response regulator transcription factor [Hymenobacter glacialis]|uniref:Transcriptional regulator n=1 Tax=Hymenobacter glacialis TaxID=1908236 RepID=A0A1G1TDA4_9BACT|nr:response regulator [Hymenobacter glacialis]OGX88851.1 transcriptional regulator [Hymenobacter glacialis]